MLYIKMLSQDFLGQHFLFLPIFSMYPYSRFTALYFYIFPFFYNFSCIDFFFLINQY